MTIVTNASEPGSIRQYEHSAGRADHHAVNIWQYYAGILQERIN